MTIDGYEIKVSLEIKEKSKVILLTYFMPTKLDEGIFDQIRANGFGYVDDNIEVF